MVIIRLGCLGEINRLDPEQSCLHQIEATLAKETISKRQKNLGTTALHEQIFVKGSLRKDSTM